MQASTCIQNLSLNKNLCKEKQQRDIYIWICRLWVRHEKLQPTALTLLYSIASSTCTSLRERDFSLEHLGELHVIYYRNWILHNAISKPFTTTYKTRLSVDTCNIRSSMPQETANKAVNYEQNFNSSRHFVPASQLCLFQLQCLFK